MILRKILFVASLALATAPAGAQTLVDAYNRAYALASKYNGKVYYDRVEPVWLSGSEVFWYVRYTPDGNRYVKVDARRCTRTPLFNHEALVERLSAESGRMLDERKLYLQRCRVSGKADTLWFEYDGRRWCYDIPGNRLSCNGRAANQARREKRYWSETDDEKGGGAVVSPDGKYVAYIKDSNLYVRERSQGDERPLSIDGTPGNYYSSHILWSPDSRKIAVCRIRPVAEKRYIYYVESSPENQLQPRLHRQEYAKPGDELPYKEPRIFEVETGRVFCPSTALFSSPYEVSRLRWESDSRALTFEYNERGHKVYRLLEFSAVTGEVKTLIEEQEEKYVNYTRIYRHHLQDGRRIIWSSERDNYNHLYLYDRRSRKPARQITKGAWYVRGVQHVDEEKQQIYFSANGMNTQEDPYLIHYYRIDFDGSNLVALTPEEGMHRVWYSPDFTYLVDVYSQVDVPPVAVLRDATDGRVVMELERADISRLLAEGWRAPEVFAAKGRDGTTDMWGIIYRPSDFDETRSYPVVEYIYSGPGDQYVPKSFAPYNWFMSSLAELGFIVVQVDGMTTSFRSKSFEEVCYKNLKDAGLPDHMAWIRAAAKKYPSIDTSRVGIFGCSAGGQEALSALLFYPDFYKAAYSACGCHDNRMDKIWWNEQWMGYPVDESYRACSNVENAHLLRRPLMLLVGELDDNVDPASTMQVVDALIKAGKDFELVVIPGVGHTMGERFGEHKRYDFFVRHLMGVNPPAWSDIKTR